MINLAERGEAVTSLEQLLTGAVAGRGQVAVVSSLVGTGRSVLLHSFADWAVELGALPMVATGTRTERNLPLGVLNQLFHDAPLPPAKRSQVRALLDRSTIAATGSTDVGPIDAQIMYALCGFLIELSENYPLAIIIDDAHLADRPSLVFTSYLARRVRLARVLLLVGCIEGSHPVMEPLQSELLPSQHTHRVRLAPLTEPGVAEMASARVSAATAAQHATTWHALSGGNPMLVNGLLDDYRSAAAADRLGDVPVSDGYGHAVVSCLRRGGPGTWAIGKGLAILSDPDAVHRLLDLDAASAKRTVRTLTAAGLLYRGTFRHPAAGRAVLDSIEDDERKRLHRRAAALTYDRGDPPRIVAQHLLRSGHSDQPWAVPVLEESARQALREGHVEHAVALLELASRHCVDEHRRSQIMTTLVRAAWRINPSLPSSYLQQLANNVRNGQLCADDAMVVVKALLWHGRTVEAQEVLAHLDNHIQQETSPEIIIARPWLRCTYPWLLPHLPATDQGQVSLPTTVATSQRLAAVSILADVLAGCAGNDTSNVVEQILRSSRLDEMSMDTVECALLALTYSGHATEAGPWCDMFIAEAQSRNAPSRHARLRAVKAEVCLQLGDLAAATDHARSALDIIPPASWGVSVGRPLATLVMAGTNRGQYAQVREWLDQSVPPAMFDTRFGLSYLYARGQYSLNVGHATLAIQDFRRCGTLMESWRLDAPGLAPWRIGAAQAYLAMDRSEQAIRLIEQQLKQCKINPRTKGLALRVAAATSPATQRPALLRQAAQLLETSGDRHELGCTFWLLAEAYESVGDRRRAGTARHRARGLTGHGQTHTIVPLGPGEVSTANDDPPKRDVTRPAATLSEAEQRVAALAAMCYTNRDIASRLYVTVSTVEQHLTRVYRKLEIASRAELPSNLKRAIGVMP